MRASEASRPVAAALEKLGICFAKNGRWNGEAVLAPLPGPRAMLILEALRRQQPGITPERLRFLDGRCGTRHPGGAWSATPDGGVPRAARGRPE
jgi:hypothetical protein